MSGKRGEMENIGGMLSGSRGNHGNRDGRTDENADGLYDRG